LLLLGADPLADFPDRSLAEHALDAVPFTVAIDCFLNASNAGADVILPAAAYGERRGSFTNIEGRISWLGQKVSPPGSAWPDWMIAAELAQRLGCDLGVDDLESIWAEIGTTSPAHLGITASVLTGTLARDGVLTPYDPSSIPAPRSKLVIDPTSDPGIGSAELHVLVASSMDVTPARQAPRSLDAIRSGAVLDHPDPAPPLPLVAADDGPTADPHAQPPAPTRAQPPTLLSRRPTGSLTTTAQPGPTALARQTPAQPTGSEPGGGPLRLVAVRTLWDHGTLVAHSSSLAGLAPAQRLRVHPDELRRLGLPEGRGASGMSGDEVLVSSAKGQVQATLSADPTVALGSAVLTVNIAGANPAELIDSTVAVTDVWLARL
jgi:anaerobic selenocysteine-containing dehydrogenase